MQSWDIVKDVFVAVVAVCGAGFANSIQGWLKRIYEQLKSLNDTQVRHDERITHHHERLENHESRISNLEKHKYD